MKPLPQFSEEPSRSEPGTRAKGMPLLQFFKEFIEPEKEELRKAPVFEFFADQSLDTRLRFSFAPIVTPWAFGFGDINKFILRDESANDPIQKIINTHTEEDDSHWKWFLHDLRELGMDDPNDFGSLVKFLWSDHCAQPRKTVYGLIGLIAPASPKMRMVIVEAIEAAGNVGFTALSQLSREFHRDTGRTLLFFGDLHLGHESGHAMGTENVENELAKIILSDEEVEQAKPAVKKVFQLIRDIGDAYIKYAKAYPRLLKDLPAKPKPGERQAK